MRRDAAPRNGLSSTSGIRRVGPLACLLAVLGGCVGPESNNDGDRAENLVRQQALEIELLWVGTGGARAEYFLDSSGRIRLRVARRRRGAQPLFDQAWEGRVSRDRMVTIARGIEESGVFFLTDRIEDLSGGAESLYLTLALRGRRVELRSRVARTDALDRLIAILDEDLPVHGFETLPNGPARRRRPSVRVDAGESLAFHERWRRAAGGRRELLLDTWLLARLVGDRAKAARFAREIDRDQDLVRLRDSCESAPVTPIR